MRATRIVVLAAALAATAWPWAEAPAGLDLSASITNVAGAPDTARFEILRWSTDDERQRLLDAWNQKPAPTAAGKGAAKAAAKGRGPAAPTVAASPEESLAKALQEAPTVGYLWSSENAGYALRYAGRFPNADGSQRIVLLTQRRLGSLNPLWKPTFQGAPNAYEFSAIELRTNAKGEGEGKVSLVGKIAADPAIKMVTLENYQALPAIFEKARRRATQP
ncbi:MAG: hypothetical protein ABIR70_10120 [Bryobacteraceae bacterium]